MILKEETQINPLSIFVEYKKAFNLGAHDEMRMFKTQPDELGMIHYRYQQYHKGIPVFGLTMWCTALTDARFRLTEALLKGCRLAMLLLDAVSRRLLKKQLLLCLQQVMHGRMPTLKLVKEQTQNPAATNYPKGELLFIDDGITEFNPESYRLAWKLDIWVFENGVSTTAFVDANTGGVFRKIPLARECNGGTVSLQPGNGNRAISTTISGSNYILNDDCSGSHPYTIRTRDFRTGSLVEFTDADKNWTTNLQRSGGTAHWSLHNVADYYTFIHGRSSFDDAAAQTTQGL